ncbi:segregation and condensation protein A [Halegenticoccus tardaugens]|uniref:segregation and condensation protein A n=1 Tax=Halegenticoccus tardaugens TaxID=2071624 RepID=UPI00100B080C|nr:ScpA family protein [Halegenticoccus tardaugens]
MTDTGSGGALDGLLEDSDASDDGGASDRSVAEAIDERSDEAREVSKDEPANAGEVSKDESADADEVGRDESANAGEVGRDESANAGEVRDDEPVTTDEVRDDEVEPVELLVQLAEDGEIEPWDIDIVEVTDAFLARLDAADLRTSGRALFYASVLLRMKSDALLAPDEADDPDPEAEPWELAMEGGADDAVPGFDPVDALEDEIDRRLDRKRARGSPETLDELVRELREAERGTWWKESRSYDTSGSPRGFSRGTQTLDYHAADDLRRDEEPTEADVTGTTHAEDIETTIESVEEALRGHYDAGRDEVLFAEIRAAGGRAVETFLALLFLAHRGHVHLQQDDLFGDLWVRASTADAPGEGEREEDEAEAVAD